MTLLNSNCEMCHNTKYMVLIFLVPVCCFGAKLNLQSFSIEIPDGWVNASHSSLREYEKLLKSTTGSSNSYDFGIQPSGRNAYFMEPPFILGALKSDERNTEKEIEAMAEQLNKHLQSTDISQILASDNAVLKSVFDNSTLGRPYFDANTKCIWSTISTQTPAFGLVHALTIQRLSPYGKVVLTAYVSDETKEKYIGEINRMISSISFSSNLIPVTDDRIGYKQTSKDSGTKGIVEKAMERMLESAGPLAILMLIAVVIGLARHCVAKLSRGNERD
jgi:hypothetical protein